MFIGRTDAKAETPIVGPPHEKNCLIGKDSDVRRDWGQEEKGMTEDEMNGWHHRLNGHEFEQVLMTVASQYNLKSRRLIPLAPFSFLKTAVAIQGLLCFHINYEIFCSSSVKDAIANLIWIALNL